MCTHVWRNFTQYILASFVRKGLDFRVSSLLIHFMQTAPRIEDETSFELYVNPFYD